MPWRSRLAIAGIPWHIIQRGNNRCACFYLDNDYRYYLATLHEQASKYHCAIHAYVLMTSMELPFPLPEQASCSGIQVGLTVK